MTREAHVATPGRLDAVLAELTGLPRADVQRAIAAGRVTVDGVARAKSFRLAGGEALVDRGAGRRRARARGPPVPVRYRDEHLLVIAKPPGLVTHPTENRRSGTFVNRLLGMGVPLSTTGGPLRPGIVHRLDAGTSGLMVIARTDACPRGPRGDAEGPRRSNAATWRWCAARWSTRRSPSMHPWAGGPTRWSSTTRRAARPRRPSRSASASTALTLLEAIPKTGRTHQIRVHLQAIGHPIVGDKAYGGGGDAAKRLGLQRPFLHSWKIAFDQPMSGERIELEEPLPEDLETALRLARAQTIERA